MSFCADNILILAGTIYSGINSPSAQSIGYISGWLTNPANLGDLNNKLSTCFSFSGDCIIGGFGSEEASVYQLTYNTDYYESQSLAILVGGGTFWTSITEGDTKINRSDMVAVSRQFLALQKSSQDTMRLAIQDYKRKVSLCVSIDASDLPSWPSP